MPEQISPTARSVVVTGGARGIGLAIAERFLTNGAQVAIVDKLSPPDRLTLRADASHFRVDLADPSSYQRVAGEIMDQHGRIDVLVNNAATGFAFVDLVEIEASYWDEVLAVNLRAVALLSKAFLPQMIARRQGVIINVASCSAFQPEPGHAAYAASKAGLIAMTRSLAREVGRHNVRVLSVVPGWIATDTNVPSDADRRWLADNVSLGRAGKPEEIAEVVSFLASDAASYITGQAIIVDGGMI